MKGALTRIRTSQQFQQWLGTALRALDGLDAESAERVAEAAHGTMSALRRLRDDDRTSVESQLLTLTASEYSAFVERVARDVTRLCESSPIPAEETGPTK